MFASLNSPESIAAFVFSIVATILVLRVKYSKGSHEIGENEAKGSFRDGLLKELETARTEAHNSRVRWTDTAIEVARLTEALKALADDNAKLIEANRRLGHANQNLKQLLVIHAPPQVVGRVVNSDYGVLDDTSPKDDL